MMLPLWLAYFQCKIPLLNGAAVGDDEKYRRREIACKEWVSEKSSLYYTNNTVFSFADLTYTEQTAKEHYTEKERRVQPVDQFWRERVMMKALLLLSMLVTYGNAFTGRPVVVHSGE